MAQTELDNESFWIRNSQQGDHEAFELLVAAHQRMIHAVTYRMTGSLADAEDLAQETFIQAYRQLPSFRGDSKFSSWLYRIAVNLALNWQKSRARRQQLLDNWASMQETAPTVADPRSHKIQEALLKLNPKQRAAVVLTIYEGLNHAETARVLRCSETTVSWRLFSARAKLKKILGEISHD